MDACRSFRSQDKPHIQKVITLAIPSLLCWRVFRSRVDGFVIDMEQQAIKLVEILQGQRK